jgi:lysophospholipid acyltransferase (LPLAT)-like uncharacterized protein
MIKVRYFFYHPVIQYSLAKLIALYLRFVLLTSKKYYHFNNEVEDLVKSKKSIIIAVWHDKVALSHDVFTKVRKKYKKYNFHVLASKHGDGMIIGKILNNFKIKSIYGSTRKEGKEKRGISLVDFRKIFKLLKSGAAICITPDGPRGPRHKITGHLVNIAKISQAPIFPASYYISNKKIFNTWDKFVFPLPFSKIYFYIGEGIKIPKNLNENKISNYNDQIKKALDDACNQSKKLYVK